MIQLSDSKQKSEANVPAAKSAGRTSATSTKEKPSANSKLGYEVLYGRRNSSVQVPLSIPKEDESHPSTGSALLDSFVSQAIAEPAALRHLRLINIANQQRQSPPPFHSPAATTTKEPAATKEPTLPKKASVPLQATTTVKPSKRPPTVTIARNSNKTTVLEPPSNLFKPAVNVPPVSAPATSTPKPATTSTTPTSSPKASTLAQLTPPLKASPPNKNLTQPIVTKTQPIVTKALSDQPPAAAEPATINPVLSPRKPPTATPVSSKLSTPTLAPTPSAAPTFAATPTGGHKIARNNAAAVGLIDINDTLLFGGDHKNLASTDPFIEASPAQGDHAGTLSYLSQQISAFTVSRLKSGFPNNTDPKVLNRPDPPKHKTVLDIQNFKLSQLNGARPAEQRRQRLATASPQDQGSTPEINVLNQQVNALNQKIAALSQQLAQVTQEKDHL